MLNCEDVRLLLPHVILGDVTVEERAALEAHLAVCETCRAVRLEHAAVLDEVTRALRQVAIPAPLPPGAWWQQRLPDDASAEVPDGKLPGVWRDLSEALHRVAVPERLTEQQVATIFERVEEKRSAAKAGRGRRARPFMRRAGWWVKVAAALAVAGLAFFGLQRARERAKESTVAASAPVLAPVLERASVRSADAALVALDVESSDENKRLGNGSLVILDARRPRRTGTAKTRLAASPKPAGLARAAQKQAVAKAPAAALADTAQREVTSVASSETMAANDKETTMRTLIPQKVASALTTALAGAVLASGEPLYWGGGTSDIPDGTPLGMSTSALTGTWDTTTKNWAAEPAGARYTVFTNGACVQLGLYTNEANATITLLSDVQVGGLTAALPTLSGYNHYFELTASVPVTLTAVGDTCLVNTVAGHGSRGIHLLSNVSLSGDAPIEKIGYGGLGIDSDSSAYTGTVTVRQSSFSVNSSAALRGVRRFNVDLRLRYANNSGVESGALYANGTGGACDQFGDDAAVVLGGGARFDWRPAASTTAETLGSIDLESWSIVGYSSAQSGKLTLSDTVAGLTRGTTGRGMGMFCTAADGTPAPRVSVLNGLPTDTLLPWLNSGRSEFMMVNSANQNILTRIAPTLANPDVSLWTGLYGSSDNVCVGTNDSVALTGTLTSDLTLQTLGFCNASIATLDLGVGNTLSLAAGGIAFRSAGKNQTITNGYLTTGAPQLYLHTGDSSASASLIIRSAITGAFEVVKGGVVSVEFGGDQDNTYTGLTTVAYGTLSLNKKNGALALSGPLDIRPGGIVSFGANNQIATGSDILVERDGYLSSSSQAYAGVLTLEGGTLSFANSTLTLYAPGTGLVFNGGYLNQNSGYAGTLKLQTDVRYEASATTQARFERLNASGTTGGYYLELGGGVRTFDVADSATLAAGVPEMVIDTTIVHPASLADDGVIKTGNGVLQLTGTNTYVGGTAVNGGTLHVAKIQTAAQSGLTAYLFNSRITFNAPVARGMALGQPISGSVIASGATVLRVLNDYEIFIDKNPGTSGFCTDAAVEAMERGGTLGNGPVAVNATGTLKIDAGIALTNAVTVGTSGMIDASGAELGSLAINGGTLVADLTQEALVVSTTVSLTGATLVLDGKVSNDPVVILRAGNLNGSRFTVVPENVSVVYKDNTVMVGSRRGTVICVM